MSILRRFGDALHALAGSSSGAVPPILGKASGAPFPFDKIPLVDGTGGDKVTKPFAESVWVQAAIKKISTPIADVPLRFRDPVTEQEIEGEPWLEFWQNPAAEMDYSDFIEALVG